MTIEQRFIAFDGKEFKTKEECIAYEKFIPNLTDIISSLKQIREICRNQKVCSNTCSFYNNCSEDCLLKEEFPEYWDVESIGD